MKKLSSCLRKSPQKSEEFRFLQEEMEEPQLKLIAWCETRWLANKACTDRLTILRPPLLQFLENNVKKNLIA